MDLFLKPEIALKRAHELINLGQKQDALQTLHDVITSKRYRSWQKIHETIMSKYVELCVDLRKGQFAKDGLIQYRFICQQVNVSSMEEVVKRFIHLSTEKAEKACSQAQEMEQALDVDDLEADKRPEDLLMCYVSGEKGKDRSDRELVTPWFKFLWETYRIVLEILRNHSKFEALYAMTAHRALQFCKQYKRKTEFRRLCEILRNHLANLNKHQDQRNRPDLSAPESLQLYLDTRFEQMKIATELELWQEAFRSVEDIHGLMCMVKKTPKPSLMTVYYVKLIEIFWISSSHLYHAYAWFKLFLLQKSFNKNLSQKDLELLASSVVLAALSAPPHDRNLELEHQKERNLRMANLIGFNLENKMNSREVLSRSSLLAELASKGVMSCVAQEVKDIYYLLEHKFLPSDLALKVLPLLNKISKLGGKFSFASSVPEVQLSQYVPALKKLATLRLLQQVSNVYQAMKVENLARMMPFSDFSIVEKISVDAIKQKFISMKVDHMKKVVIFCKKSLEPDDLWDHLASSAEPLNEAREMICPPDRKQSKLGPLLPSLLEVVAKDHKILLARKSIIEKRKEEQEQEQKLLLHEMELEEESNRLRLQEINEDTEQSQPATVHEQVNNQRILQEIAEREHEEAERRRNEELAFTEQRRKRQEMEKRLQKLGKTMDFLERAKREEAAPLIEAAYQQRLVEERILHALEQQREVELSKQRHAGDLNEKERLSRMVGNKEKYQEKVVNHRRVELEERIMLQSRKQEREKMRKYKYYLQLEEERQLESAPAAPATSSAPTPGKYIPRFRRGGA